jgi:hypothetical protein
MLWLFYRLRLHQMAREFNAHLEGRVDERLRVGRGLHDTLLQQLPGPDAPVADGATSLLGVPLMHCRLSMTRWTWATS